MSLPPLSFFNNFGKIEVKKDRDNERKKYSSGGMSRAWNKSIRVSKRAGHNNCIYCTMEYKRSSQNGKKSYGISTQILQARTAVKNYKRVSKSVTKSKYYLIYIIYLLSNLSELSFFTNILQYNSCILKVKGYKMSSIKIDLQELIISSEIENGIEYKLQSIKSLIDVLEIGEE